MSTDWKALAAELAAELERCRPLAEAPDCLARARASLTADGPAVQSREPASVVGEPSDEELLDLSQFHCLSYTMSDGSVVSPYVEDTDIRSDVLSFARAVLARYGHLPIGIEQALIKAECALSDIADGEPEPGSGSAELLQWAEQRCAKTLAIIRPVMKQHQIRTSEWPPLSAHALPLLQGEVEK